MLGTPTAEQLRQVVATSLHALGGGYRIRAGGDLQYEGPRPSGHWIKHGYCQRKLYMLVDGEVVRRRIWKQRWLQPELGGTCHSRPPDDAAQVWSCTLIITLKLWAWLGSGKGAASAPEVVESLETHVSVPTVERWLHRAVRRAAGLEQAIRHALIERCEPRPVEHLFQTGLSPPEELMRRRWCCDPSEIAALWRALALLFGGAFELSLPIPCLLAEARGRLSTGTGFPF